MVRFVRFSQVFVKGLGSVRMGLAWVRVKGVVWVCIGLVEFS